MNRNEQKVLREALGIIVEKDKRIAELEAQKKVIYCEAIALLTQVNGTPMEVTVAHDYLTKLYEGGKNNAT